MEMGIDGFSGPLHDDLMQPQAYANFVEPIQEDESLTRGYRLSIQQCQHDRLHGCFKGTVLKIARLACRHNQSRPRESDRLA
jgi:hypothetical protein